MFLILANIWVATVKRNQKGVSYRLSGMSITGWSCSNEREQFGCQTGLDPARSEPCIRLGL